MAHKITEKTIVLFQDAAGKEPYTEWFIRLRQPATRQRIVSRILRVEHGNYGDFKSLKDGVFELRLDFGPGYRIYFGEDGDTIVVLLCGGTKGTQTKDIEMAKAYWKEYQGHGET